ncbi:hypothetical protein [Leucobacter celer]|uniref:hypothetical protein n=1 Tax=Leucobacter celer TaxID=668625 RepID=UPI0012F90C62|nr:hypothetical protein [Leucobacter celer]
MAEFVRRFVRLGIFCPFCHVDVTCVRLLSNAENGEIAAMVPQTPHESAQGEMLQCFFRIVSSYVKG